MPVRLLRLPYDAQKIILNQRTLKEKFIFSTLSNRSRNLVRRILKGQSFSIHFHNNRPTRIKFDKNSIMTLHIDTPNFQSVFDFLRTSKKQLSDDDLSVFLLNHLTYILNQPEVSLSFDGKSPWNTHILERIKRLNLKCSKVDAYNCNYETAQYLLQNCNDARKLVVSTSKDVKCSVDELQPFQSDWVSIDMNTSLTVDQFIFLFNNCERVVLEKQIFNDNDIIKLFLWWMENSKAEHIQVKCCKEVSMKRIMEELDGTEVRDKVIVSEGEVETTGMRFVIYSKNRTKALIYRYYSWITLITFFQLIPNGR
ncbi:hypothetical protein CAEBREN_23720 [Caenorhabditis brenneri]|uniref:F-box domain-containing protein n=1 Tax=Caenorhabditis brenneri TaxID=135651 RepID=G0NJE2_CAEBE|nr:hypothetical protein CAEBREN_23720 [Caenorhabditis brenneri]